MNKKAASESSAPSLNSSVGFGPLRFLLSVPSDPLFESDRQWHLGFIGSPGFVLAKSASTSAGIETIWTDYQGDDIDVGIWDDGVQKSHWDLAENYDSSKQVTISGTLNDGQPLTGDDGHGTSVAGLIAGDDNGLGGIGIAFDAQLTAIRIFGGADDINNYWSRYLLTLDSLRNFDVTNHSYGGYPDFYVFGDVAKFQAAAVAGRDGLGTINVKSAGNDNIDGNGDALDSSRFTVTVAALSNTATANAASYSTYGAHVLVSAPAASVTTDLAGEGAGYDGLLSGDYTDQFGGTSAAGPVTAGVVSLMLDANSALGWRDVQNILAYSAIGVGSLYSGVTTNENFSWKWNGSSSWNGGGLHYSEDYGYGMVNAYNAVRMAEAWSIFQPVAGTSSNEAIAATGNLTTSKTISDLSTTNYTFNVAKDVMLDHVALKLSLTHTYFTDLRIRLISPEGTVMSLYDGSTGDSTTSDGTLTYTFGADGFRGESSAGNWTVQIQDVVRGDSGSLKSVSFTGYGSSATSDDVYHYTSEILEVLSTAGQSGRINLSDTDGGTDWIDGAAMVGSLTLDLTAGETSTVGGEDFLTLANGTSIENAIGGDGSDRIVGNAAGNVIYGMRGDDILVGGDGRDVAAFRGSYDSYTIISLDGVTTVSGLDGTDTLTGFEVLRFDDGEHVDPSMPPDLTAPTLSSTTPADNASGVSVSASLKFDFSETIVAGTGAVSIWSGEAELFESIAVTSGMISGSSLTIDPTGIFAAETAYYVTIDAGAVRDSSGNDFAGISDVSNLNFVTELPFNVINGDSRGNKLFGTSGNDSISGFGGNDVLSGRLGSDKLIGGTGKDVFMFDTGLSLDNIDLIQGFSVVDDTIQLENAIFTKLTSRGALSSAYFRSGVDVSAQDADDYILFDTAVGKIYYDADGSGAAAAVQFTTIVDLVGSVTRADFVVV